MNQRTLETALRPLLAQWWRREGYTQGALAAMERSLYDTQSRLREEDVRAVCRLIQVGVIPVQTKGTK